MFFLLSVSIGKYDRCNCFLLSCITFILQPTNVDVENRSRNIYEEEEEEGKGEEQEEEEKEVY